MVRSTDSFALRIWVVDNSGSLNNVDGHVLVQTKDPPYHKMIGGTRWEEVTSSVLWHSRFNAEMGAPMVIRLVNDPGANVGPQQLGVAASDRMNVNDELHRLRRLLKCHPGGSTPLTVHLKDILASLSDVHPNLLEGKMISIVIVTDRLPTDGEGSGGQDVNFEFLATLKSFQDFPVWIVIRLSTDDQQVVNFYNSLDRGIAILRQLRGEADHARRENIHLDVLDDFVHEAAKVSKHNPWLNYGLPLHLTRESCIESTAFDAINDRPLDFVELGEFVALLFDRHGSLHGGSGLKAVDDRPLPNPHSNYRDFRKDVQELCRRSGDLWNPLKQKLLPWINLKQLDRIYASGAPVTNDTVAAATTCSCQIS